MNNRDRLELYEKALENKYGLLFPLYAPIKELKMHCHMIDLANEETKRQKENPDPYI